MIFSRTIPSRSHRVQSVVAIVAIGISTIAQAQWTDVSSGVMGGLIISHGASWADFDNDGDLDVYVTLYGFENYLFRNDGNDVFVDATFFPLNMPGLSKSGRSVWADFDNDGDLDVYIAQGWRRDNINAGSQLLRNDWPDGFTDITNGEPLEIQGRLSRGGAWADYDNDGLLDLYVSTNAGNKLLHNEGNEVFTSIQSMLMEDIGMGRGVLWGDFDNDGDTDLFLVNGDDGIGDCNPPILNANKLFGNSNGAFYNATSGPLGDIRDGRAACWGDYDNDGDLDLFISNLIGCIRENENQLLRNDGRGVFVDVTPPVLASGFNTRGCSWVDYDNDGDLDLYVANMNVRNELFRNDLEDGFVEVTDEVIGHTGSASGAAWADYDGDGDMDVYLVNNGQGDKLLRNDQATGNHWIEIELQGTISNRTGIGARITASTSLNTQIREIQSGSGYRVQHMIPAHFGLGSANVLDTLTVRWPSGILQVLHDVQVDQYLTIVEEDDCLADFNNDGNIDTLDFIAFLGAFNNRDPRADINYDGTVDTLDFLHFLNAFVIGCE